MPVEDVSAMSTFLRNISEGFKRSPEHIVIAVGIVSTLAVKAW